MVRARRDPCTLALALLAASGAAADPAPTATDPRPTAAVRAVLEDAGQLVVSDRGREAKLAELSLLARQLLDTERMAWLTLGDTLRTQPAEAQREFVALYDEVIVRAYLRRLLLFRTPRFAYLGEVAEPPGPALFGEPSGRPRTRVRTAILTSRDRFSVDYLMQASDGRWWASDIVIEGVSLTDNYRAQFESLLRGQSFEELLERMRRKLGSPREPG